ncbi:hypothetical protein GPECTOR_3g193 [Gonium pectorale]|uniref:Uncharacterized protein n=1 Tax=Gonium pectorale TaxID=33097 RepID=A0A150GZ94_GONPE|nr:hypothetical protein GPECTOR_3g193 [Gonium pectorale]|eukprot:KXZ55032.1 hypothetical protein GPECTOR_3g193 [Gonium pectorale]
MQWLSSLVSEYDARPLQKAGMLTKEFKQILSVALKTRGPGASEDAINAMQKEIFEAMGVQGDFGIKCLSRVSQVYGTDAFFLRQFYEHVQKEEMVLDEAEMPEVAFKSKYEQLNKFRADMEERMRKLQDMTPEEQERYMSNVYKEMISQNPGGACCHNPHGCSHRPAGGEGAAAGGVAPAAVTAGVPPALAGTAPGPGGSSAMTEAEQLAFFASLKGAGNN